MNVKRGCQQVVWTTAMQMLCVTTLREVSLASVRQDFMETAFHAQVRKFLFEIESL